MIWNSEKLHGKKKTRAKKEAKRYRFNQIYLSIYPFIY